MKNSGVFIGLLLMVILTACGGAPKVQPSTFYNDKPVAKQTPPFVPPDGKILMVMGQDLEANRDYSASITDPKPAGVTTYSSLVVHDLAPCPVLGGLTRGTGPDAICRMSESSQSAIAVVRENPNAVLAVGLYMAHEERHGCSTKWLDIINTGAYDEYIEEMGKFFQDLKIPVLLRIGYEFDGYWNCYQPEQHKAAFRRIVTIFRNMGVDNVASVWQSASWPYDKTDWELWYPGDEYVDWVSFSYFLSDNRYKHNSPPDPSPQRDSILAFARAHNKPVFIAESASQGYDNKELTRSPISHNEPVKMTAEEIWDSWFDPYFNYIYKNKDVIKAVAYINSDWDSNPDWVCQQGVPGGREGCQRGMWGDTRVTANPVIRDKWLAEMAKDDWLHSSGDLFSQLGYTGANQLAQSPTAPKPQAGAPATAAAGDAEVTNADTSQTGAAAEATDDKPAKE